MCRPRKKNKIFPELSHTCIINWLSANVWFNEEKIAFSTDGARTIRYPYSKKKKKLHSLPPKTSKNHSKWITALNIRMKMITLPV